MGGLEQYYEFSPSDQRLIDVYLRSKIAGKDVGGGSIHDADVASDHPYDLVRKHAPARGSLTARNSNSKGVWFFFSPKRYVGNSKARSRLAYRARTVLGVDGSKKGAWHAEGRKMTVPRSAGGYFQKLSYQEVTPSGSVVKPGWLMIEYSIEDEHGGGGDMVLCKVYESPRGPGGSVVSPSRKRKQADAVQQIQRPCKQRTHEEAMFSVGNLLQREDSTATDYYYAAAAYRETEHVLGSGESAASKKTDHQMRDEEEGQGRIQEDARDERTRFWESLMATGQDQMAYFLQEDQPPCAAQTTEDQGDVMEIGFEEFMGSSALTGAVPQPCAAQPPEDDAGTSCVQMSQVQPANDDGDEIWFTLEELMGSSSTPGGCSSVPSPEPPITDDDDDDDDMRGLACPPVDYAILEALVELGPAAIMEEENYFICDLLMPVLMDAETVA